MGKWNTHAPHVLQHGSYQLTKQEALKVVLVKRKTVFTEWSLVAAAAAGGGGGGGGDGVVARVRYP